MKNIWLLLFELKRNKISMLMLTISMSITVVCYVFCFTLMQQYIESYRFLKNNYGHHIKAYIDGSDSGQIAYIRSEADPMSSVSITHYYSRSNPGLFINVINKEFFDNIYDSCDQRSEYKATNQILCFAPPQLKEKYVVGNTYLIDGVEYYVCASLPDNNIFYLGNMSIGSSYLLAYDPNHLINNSNCGSIGTCIIMGPYTEAFLENIRQLKDIGSIELFDWKKELMKDYSELSGVFILCIWVTVISIIGIISNVILTFNANRNVYQGYLREGASRSKITRMYIDKLLISASVSTVVAMLIVLLFNDSLYGITYSLLFALLIIILIILFMTVIISKNLGQFTIK